MQAYYEVDCHEEKGALVDLPGDMLKDVKSNAFYSFHLLRAWVYPG